MGNIKKKHGHRTFRNLDIQYYVVFFTFLEKKYSKIIYNQKNLFCS